MKKIKNAFKEVKYTFWKVLSIKCKVCPFAGSDWSDYNSTGYVGPKCYLYRHNECEGCATPLLVIWLKYRKKLKDSKKEL